MWRSEHGEDPLGPSISQLDNFTDISKIDLEAERRAREAAEEQKRKAEEEAAEIKAGIARLVEEQKRKQEEFDRNMEIMRLQMEAQLQEEERKRLEE